MDSEPTYWAAKPGSDFAQEAWAKIRAYYDFASSSPIFKRIAKAYRQTYGIGDENGVSWLLQRGGAKGELVKMQGGDYRNLSEYRVTIATQNKPAWQPVATNSDHASLTKAKTFNGVLDYYWREKRAPRYLRKAVKDIQWAAEGFVFGNWDATAGADVAVAYADTEPQSEPMLDPETGEPVQAEGMEPEPTGTMKEGDLVLRSVTTLDVARDPYADSWDSCSWLAVRVWENKFDLAAQYPEHAEDIERMSGDQIQADSRTISHASESDEVAVYHFFHKKTPAKPDGRYAVMVSEQTVLMDVPLPFRTVPVFRAVEDELEGTPFGYSAMFDTLGPIDAADKLEAAILTQQMNHAVAKIVEYEGSPIGYRMLSQALGVLKVKSRDQKPELLNLASVEPQVFQHEASLRQRAQSYANLNDVVRGVASENIKSGSHAALYDAIAPRGANALQEAYFGLCEDVGTFVLHCLVDFADQNSQRTARIMGEHNRQEVISFTPADIDGFERVTVEATNAVTKTPLGKKDIADELLQKGVLGTGPIAAQQYLTLIKTGELEQMTDAPQAHVLRLKSDKEKLAKGQVPVIVATDPHWLDIPEYLAVLATPGAREDENVVNAVGAAVQQKLAHWRMMDPDLLAVMGGQPLPSMAQPAGAAPVPPPGAGGPVPNDGGGASTGTDPQEPRQPSMPHDPTTGEQHDPNAQVAIA